MSAHRTAPHEAPTCDTSSLTSWLPRSERGTRTLPPTAVRNAARSCADAGTPSSFPPNPSSLSGLTTRDPRPFRLDASVAYLMPPGELSAPPTGRGPAHEAVSTPRVSLSGRLDRPYGRPLAHPVNVLALPGVEPGSPAGDRRSPTELQRVRPGPGADLWHWFRLMTISSGLTRPATPPVSTFNCHPWGWRESNPRPLWFQHSALRELSYSP